MEKSGVEMDGMEKNGVNEDGINKNVKKNNVDRFIDKKNDAKINGNRIECCCCCKKACEEWKRVGVMRDAYMIS